MFNYRKLTHSSFFAYTFHYPSVFIGILVFIVTRKTPWISYWSMRKLYAIRGAEITNMISRICEKLDYKHRNKKTWGHNSIFKYTQSDVKAVSDALKKDGFCVMPFQLPDQYIQPLTELATQTECKIRLASIPGRHKVDLENPVGPWYEIPEDSLLKQQIVLQLANDSLFLDVAQSYLGTPPINDYLALWWTLPHVNSDTNVLAQMYHFDFDRLNFLKFFFYLTDVDMTNGPHCFVKGSHKSKAHELNQDRRYEDDEILKAYGKENEVIMTGRRGLILAEDTRGFHKGLSPLKGNRLMFQLEYTSCLFGQDYLRKKIEPDSEIYQAIKDHPTLWQRCIE